MIDDGKQTIKHNTTQGDTKQRHPITIDYSQ